MTNIKKISDFNFKSKKVLVRVDLNVPIKNGIVADATRIKAILPTLNQISRKGGICIIISHFGQPKGKKIGMYSLKKIVKPQLFENKRTLVSSKLNRACNARLFRSL